MRCPWCRFTGEDKIADDKAEDKIGLWNTILALGFLVQQGVYCVQLIDLETHIERKSERVEAELDASLQAMRETVASSSQAVTEAAQAAIAAIAGSSRITSQV